MNNSYDDGKYYFTHCDHAYKKIINTTLHTMEMEESDNVTMDNGYDDGKYYFTQRNFA